MAIVQTTDTSDAVKKNVYEILPKATHLGKAIFEKSIVSQKFSV